MLFRSHLIRDIIIKPRAPKWERRFLMKKEAEEYFVIHNSRRHPAIKKYHKSRHFLKWSIKLLVPDFLIGHPNLWDNLKILRKHPQFKPLRMALIAWMIFSITAGGLGIYSIKYAVKTFAATIADDTQAEFDAGTYSDTQWDGTNNWVELDATGLTNGSGNYTSSVKDGGGNSTWNSIAWAPERPVGKELPDNAVSETAYNTGNANMTGNVLLMHMNEASGTIEDTSGNGNNGTAVGNPNYGATGKFNTAMSFEGGNEGINLGNDASINPTEMTLSAWLYLDGGNSNFGAILTRWTNGNAYFIGTNPNSEAVAIYFSSGLRYTTPALPTGEWVHLVVTNDGAGNTLSYYQNGAYVGGAASGRAISSSTSVSMGGISPCSDT